MHLKNKDWSVSVGANATFVKNKIKNLPATMKENGYISGSKSGWKESPFMNSGFVNGMG